jgi:hypothetical protein
VGIFMAIGIAAVIVRTILHTKNRGKLYLDDYLVLFAAACLVVESAVLLRYCDLIYTIVLLMLDPTDIVLFGRLEILEVLRFLTWNNVFLVFSWTANYAIKFSFLAFFRVLVRGVSRRLNWYWWFVFVFTIASWLFNIIENFAHCGVTGSCEHCYS